jgi:peptidoglycan/xylan/chitin deacetylase (PgdA/CDA1 family)
MGGVGWSCSPENRRPGLGQQVIKPDRYITIEIERGPSFPNEGLWIEGQRAWLPVLQDVATKPDPTAPPSGDVVLWGISAEGADRFPLVWQTAGKIGTRLKIPEWIRSMEQEAYRSEHRLPLTARLPFHYHALPDRFRKAGARLFALLPRGANDQYPVTPLNCGPEILLSAVEHSRQSRSDLRVVLTHDVDTAEGLANCNYVADAEERQGFRSSWHVVADRYPLDRTKLHDLSGRGHEIGLHGLWHNNREAFLDRYRLRAELKKMASFLDEFSIRGYRGPSWYRTSRMLDVLEDFFDYDLTCADADFMCPGGPGGVGITRPFWIRPHLLEIPCTLPYEPPMVTRRWTDDLLEFWRPKITFLRRSGGLLVVNTHPDLNYLGDPKVMRQYERLLQFLKDEEWHSILPRELAVPEAMQAPAARD